MRPLACSRRLLPLFLALLPTLALAQSWLMGEMTLDEPRRGTLLFRTEKPDLYLAAPGLETDVTIQVTGVVARTTVSQRFTNPTERWQEGVYVFPLPEDSAVDTLKVIIGERVIVGEIREKEEARRVYEQAKQEGKKAALVEQDRPDMFMTSVANIGPREVVEVRIEYQERLDWGPDGFSLRFPLTISERYHPGSKPGVPGDPTAGSPDPGAGAPPVAAGTEAPPPPTNPVAAPGEGPTVRLRVLLDAGFPLEAVRSPSHEVTVSRLGTRDAEVSLVGEHVPADRDYLLEWIPEQGLEPRSALFTQTTTEATYALLMVQPPRPDPSMVERLPRETIFVIDSSGSMSGPRIDQARKALVLALERLDPADRFEVIDFDSEARALHGQPVPATREAVKAACDWVRRLEAEGGTEMLAALRLALPSGWESDLLRQVVFITDGAVSNEDVLAAYIERHLASARLFTVGIGAAPNAHFMTRAARAGRGTFTFISDKEETSGKMDELFRKLENPVLKDLEVAWSAAKVEAWPERIPDLYLGDPLVVAARLEQPGEVVTVRGQGGGRPFEWKLPLAGGDRNPGVSRLWAREKIAALSSGEVRGMTPVQKKAAIVKVALEHHLVSEHTSLVAVEVTPSRPAGEELDTTKIPAHLPADQAPPPPPPPPAGAPIKPVPEPRTWALILLVMGLLGWENLRRRDPGR